MSFLNLYEFFLDQGPFYNTDISGRTELIFMQDLLCGKLVVNTIYNGSQEIHLIGCQALGLLLK